MIAVGSQNLSGVDQKREISKTKKVGVKKSLDQKSTVLNAQGQQKMDSKQSQKQKSPKIKKQDDCLLGGAQSGKELKKKVQKKKDAATGEEVEKDTSDSKGPAQGHLHMTDLKTTISPMELKKKSAPSLEPLPLSKSEERFDW